MSGELKNKLNANAKHFRYLSRADTFNRNRKFVDDVDYLKYYPQEKRQQILNSLEHPIPMALPPISPYTISYYRRSNKAIYRARTYQTNQIDGHMLYESLWIAASLDEKQFENYLAVTKQFEQDLAMYLTVNSVDIREMAIIVAGNKIIGREQDILGIVEGDPQQLWVLVNHVLQKKISFKHLLKYMGGNYEIIYKTIYELSNNKQDQLIQQITKEQSVMQCLLLSLHSPNEDIRKYAIRIIGNIITQSHQYTDLLHKYRILENIFESLNTSNQSVRKDACWLVANLTCERNSATKVLRNHMVIAKLTDLFTYESNMEIKREITIAFHNISHFADRLQSFQLFANQNLLEILYSHLCTEEKDLVWATLSLLSSLLQLGECFKAQDEKNVFCIMIDRMSDLREQISRMSYSQQGEISGICEQITTLLEENRE